MQAKEAIKVTSKDDVAVALRKIEAGSEIAVNGDRLVTLDEIPFGHKVAVRDLLQGQPVLRYGYPIGLALSDIQKGQWVHSHNLGTALSGLIDYEYKPSHNRTIQKYAGRKEVDLYPRSDGRFGTRNEIWIVPTVSCVNHTINILAEEARKQFGHLCDGIYALPHNAGCSQLGDDHLTTQRLLAGIVRHPNAGGVLVVSLGCENNDIAHFKPVLGDVDKARVKFLITQEVEDEIETGLQLIGRIAEEISHDKRVTTGVEHLVLGLKCGASDAFSGLTANPLCGRVVDRLCDLGGSAILTEVPEMFGAETILMNRADNADTFADIVRLINDFKQYYISYKQPIYENPSPGNKAGGLTTLEEKSLGCIQKGGRSTVTGTLVFGEPCMTPGLNLLTGPGNDNVSITNLLASGAQVLLFTTGRGNPLGTAVPTLKVASNGQLSERKKNWIDFSAAHVLEGAHFPELTDDLWNLLLDTASGRYLARNERNGYREISIFKNGVLL